MQSVLSRNWTRIAVSISCDDNHYTTLHTLLWILTNNATAHLEMYSSDFCLTDLYIYYFLSRNPLQQLFLLPGDPCSTTRVSIGTFLLHNSLSVCMCVYALSVLCICLSVCMSLCVCVCVYLYVCVYVSLCLYVSVCVSLVCEYEYVSLCLYKSVSFSLSVFVPVQVCVDMYVYAKVCVCIYIYIYIYMSVYMFIYMCVYLRMCIYVQ